MFSCQIKLEVSVTGYFLTSEVTTAQEGNWHVKDSASLSHMTEMYSELAACLVKISWLATVPPSPTCYCCCCWCTKPNNKQQNISSNWLVDSPFEGWVYVCIWIQIIVSYWISISIFHFWNMVFISSWHRSRDHGVDQQNTGHNCLSLPTHL